MNGRIGLKRDVYQLVMNTRVRLSQSQPGRTHQVIPCFNKKLLPLLYTSWQHAGVVTKVVENALKVLWVSVDKVYIVCLHGRFDCVLQLHSTARLEQTRLLRPRFRTCRTFFTVTSPWNILQKSESGT